jgi:hypothetical protein
LSRILKQAKPEVRTMRRILRYSLAVVAVVAAAVVFAQAASAMAPTTTTATLNVSGIVVSAGTLCPFDVTLDATQSSTQTTFYDSSGLISRRITTGVEQDTYSANGKTLIGDPYHFNFIGDFVDGVRVDAHSTGIVQKVPLPGGGLFIVAGRLDTFNNIGGLALTVDSGNDGNKIDAFCTALS